MEATTANEAVQPLSVLFTDVVGSTKYFKKYGDRAGRRMLQRHQDLASEPIERMKGHVVKTVGDSVMAYFISPRDAVAAAVQIQLAFQQHNADSTASEQISVRIAAHHGEGIVEESDIFGNVVNLAAKILELVPGNEIYVSEPLYQEARGLPDMFFESLKGLYDQSATKEIQIFRVIWNESVSFDPTTKVLLTMRPAWSEEQPALQRTWQTLIDSHRRHWKQLSQNERYFEDGLVGLMVKDVPTAIQLAEKVRGQAIHNGEPLPLRILIDSGPYLKIAKFFMEGSGFDSGRIADDAICITSAAYRLIRDKADFPVEPPFDEGAPADYYRLGTKKPQKESLPAATGFVANPIKYAKCYYCGGSDHAAKQCPSKMSDSATRSVHALGYSSEQWFRQLIENTPEQAAKASNGSTSDGLKPDQLLANVQIDAHYCYQLRCLSAVWDESAAQWSGLKTVSGGGKKGGSLWLILDSLRTGNHGRAQHLLDKARLDYYNDYRFYSLCALLEAEKGKLEKARQYFAKALNCRLSPVQRMYVLFALVRCLQLTGHFREISVYLRKIRRIDPKCKEATYRYLIYRMEQGHKEAALGELIDFLAHDRHYFAVSLVDSAIAPFRKELTADWIRLLDQSREEAQKMEEQMVFERDHLCELLGEKDLFVEQVDNLSEKYRKSMESRSYFGYLDACQYGREVLRIGKNGLKERKDKILKKIFELKKRGREFKEMSTAFPKRPAIIRIRKQIDQLLFDLDIFKGLLKSNDLKVLRAPQKRLQPMADRINAIGRKLERQAVYEELRRFFYAFALKSVMIQVLNLLVALILFPLITHYAVFVLPRLNIPGSTLWLYQKSFIMMAGVLGVFLALMLTVKKLYPK